MLCDGGIRNLVLEPVMCADSICSIIYRSSLISAVNWGWCPSLDIEDNDDLMLITWEV